MLACRYTPSAPVPENKHALSNMMANSTVWLLCEAGAWGSCRPAFPIYLRPAPAKSNNATQGPTLLSPPGQ